MKQLLFRAAVALTLTAACVSAKAQIVFSRFTSDPYFLKTVNVLYMNFTLEGEKEAKYVKVHWRAINNVGDLMPLTDPLPVTTTATGPWKAGKKYKTSTQPYKVYQKIWPIPLDITIVYMDGEEVNIEINEDNVKKFFPKLKRWVDIDEAGEQ